MAMSNVEGINIYRITHVDNIAHILQNGITHRNSINCNPNYTEIGDVSLINYRKDRRAITNKGEEIVLGDYIPFYFAIRTPMLYVIQNGYNQAKLIHPQDIVYIVVGLSSIVKDESLSYLFSDGHASNNLSVIYDESDIVDMSQKLDWDAIKKKYWVGDDVDADLKRRKEAEFLIKGDIDIRHIKGFVCYCEATMDKLKLLGVPEEKIVVRENFYF